MQTALLLHIIRKDLRHVRLLFGLWFALLLAQALLLGTGFSSKPGDQLWQTIYAALAMGIPLLQSLLIVILLPILIQDEPLVGSTAFWFTRPISRSTLLGAKGIFAFAFLIIPPLVLETAVLAVNRISPGDISKAVPEVLYGSLALIIPIAALATLTRTFAKFSLWIVTFFIVTVVLSFALQLLRVFVFHDAGAFDHNRYGLLISRSIASGTCYIIGGLFVISWQYYTRRTPVGVIALALSIVAAFAAQSFWPIDFFHQEQRPPAAGLFPPDSVAPSLASKWNIHETRSVTGGAESDTQIEARVAFANVPPDYQVLISSSRNSTLQLTEGPEIRSEPVIIESFPAWWPSAVSAALGGVPILNRAGDNSRLAAIFSLNSKLFDKWAVSPGTLHCRFNLEIQKIAVSGYLPLRQGASFHTGSRTIEIAEVLRESGGCRLIIRERTINLWANRKSPTLALSPERRGRYLLVNRKRNQAIYPDEDREYPSAFSLINHNMRLVNQSFPLRFTGVLGSTKIADLTAEWLADAEFVVLEAVHEGYLQRELTIEDFRLTPKP